MPHRCFHIALQVTQGVVFLHEHKPIVIHRDIKPENVLVKRDPNTKEVVFKLSDFGLSNLVEYGVMVEDEISHALTQAIKSMKTIESGRGTLSFMAPELFAVESYRQQTGRNFGINASVDIFALGVLFTYIFCYNSNDYGT